MMTILLLNDYFESSSLELKLLNKRCITSNKCKTEINVRHKKTKHNNNDCLLENKS